MDPITIGFIILGGVVAGGMLMTSFWDEIKSWLNHVAADAIEKAFGFAARNRMQIAVAVVDRLIGKIRNTSTIYTKRTATATYFDKTTIVSEAREENIDSKVLEKLEENHNRLVQEFQYRN